MSGSPAIYSLPLKDVELRKSAHKPNRLQEEVAQLFDEWRTPLLRYLLSIGLPIQDCEEVNQETFLSLYRHLRLGKPRQNLRGWLFQVAHNLGLKQRERNASAARRIVAVDPELRVQAADGSPSIETELIREQRKARLKAVFDALPEQDQCCLSLRAEGLRYREIAQVLGISLGMVAGSLERSLSRLHRSENNHA